MPCNVEKGVFSPAEAVDLIYEVGGLAILAHPIFLNDDILVENILTQGFRWRGGFAP